jgi:hypothetical protein
MGFWVEITWVLNLKNLWPRLDSTICGCTESNPEIRFQTETQTEFEGKDIERERSL